MSILVLGIAAALLKNFTTYLKMIRSGKSVLKDLSAAVPFAAAGIFRGGKAGWAGIRFGAGVYEGPDSGLVPGG